MDWPPLHMTAAKSPERWHAFAIPSPVPGDYDAIARFDERIAAVGKTQQLRLDQGRTIGLLAPDGTISVNYELRSTWPRLRGVLIRGRDADYVRVTLWHLPRPCGNIDELLA